MSRQTSSETIVASALGLPTIREKNDISVAKPINLLLFLSLSKRVLFFFKDGGKLRKRGKERDGGTRERSDKQTLSGAF